MRCAVTGGTISVANRRSTRQAQLWPGTGPCYDEEYDRTKLNNYIPQRAMGAKIPIQALKEWHEKKPDLFVKYVYNQIGLDIQSS